MTEKKQQHKKKRGKVQHIRGSPKKRKISGKAFFSSESIPGKMLADVKNQITDKASELKRADQKKLFLANFPYLMFAYFFNKIAWLYRVNTGATSWDKFMNTITYFELAFRNLWPSLNHMDLFWGIAGGVVVKFVIIYRTKNARKYRLGVEYGSARWGTEKDIRPYADPEFENNIILTETESLTMSSRPKNPKYARNKNILVIGGSGSGKTRFFVKPNIMQMHSSYVITDPKGTVLLEVGSMLAKGSPMTDENGKIVRDKEGKVIYEPYKIKVLNTINFKKSMHYNPFVYIRSEKDILKLVTTIIANTKGEGQQSGEDFWVKAEKLYYCALIGYIWYEGREEEKNFNTLLEMINVSEAREDDENFKNPVDLMFDELEQKDPNHFAVRQYKKYKLAAGKTAKSILISCGARLAPFDIAELRELMSYDELELDLVGDRKTALFVIISDTDDTFNFIVSIMYTQLFNLLCDRADDVYGGRLPIHVRCLLDEFANIGQIPKFEKLIATIRSREISASIILQSKSQLKAIYKDNADTIEGNCDTTLFLGGKEKTTLKEIAEILGKETIDLYNTSDTRGSQRSYGMNYQKIGKELMSQDEIAVMDGGKCILQVRGVRPFFSNKYDICKHKNYKYLSDYDKKNIFDIEKYLSTNLILKPEDEVELYQM
jgi:type IV secretion system protein VirD4